MVTSGNFGIIAKNVIAGTVIGGTKMPFLFLDTISEEDLAIVLDSFNVMSRNTNPALRLL